jgi:hypothetical protein
VEGDPTLAITDFPGAGPIERSDRPKLADVLGPGLITGASDEDPSGIATYAQAGAVFGFALVARDPLDPTRIRGSKRN